MKKPQMPLYLLLALSVFFISFFVGRATALKNSAENKQNAIYAGRMLMPQKEDESLPAGSVADKIEKLDEFAKESEKKTETKKEKEESKPKNSPKKEEENPPERMLFPCGQDVLKGYSQTAVYSETMDDWRAHTGIDYRAEKGTNVISVWDGTVSKIYKDSYWGYCVEIIHPGNLTSIYRNLDEKISVKEGEKIKKGQAFATVGESAVVEKRDEPHLHFELRVDGVTINPESYIY